MIYIELPDLLKVQKRLRGIPGASKWALMKTLNDVAVSGKQAAVDDIFARYYFETQSPIRSGIKTTQARADHLFAVIHITGKRFPVQSFLPTRTEPGVEIMEVRGQRASISHVFMATMRYGANVFARTGNKERPFVRSIMGLSIANMAREETKVLPDIEARIKEQLSKRAAFWMSEVLAGRMSKYGG